MDKIQISKGKLNDDEIEKIIANIRVIKNNLNEVAALNKNQLASISQDSETAKYTRTMMVYSRKISRKTRVMISSLDKPLSQNLRNAPLSSSKKVKGKKLQQILKEKEKDDNLKKELTALEKAAGRVNASSKWLYVVSK